MAEPRIDENGLPVYAPGDYDFVRVVDRSTGASRNALAPEVTAAARALSGALAQVVADAQEDIAPVIAGLGYLPPVPFASGLTVDSSRFTVSHGGEVYAPVADAIPFTTTGTFNPAQWRVIQGIVGADLLSDTGASIVALKQAGSTTYQRTVAAELLDRVSILRFIPPALHAGIRNGTSTVNLQPYFQNAVDYCVQNNRELYLPAGVYILDTASPDAGGTGPVYLSNLTANGQGLTMTGEGRGRTIIKEASGSSLRSYLAAGGGASTVGRFNKMFYFWYGTSGTFFNVGSFTFRGITFDKNGASNGSPVTASGGALGHFAWEQAHIVQWATSGAACDQVGPITFEQCEFRDKLGSCVNIGSAPQKIAYSQIVVDDVYAYDHPGIDVVMYGQRGDFEFGCDVENCTVDKVTARYTQIEPTTVSSPTHVRRYRMSNSKIDAIEYTDSGGYSFVDVINCYSSNKLLVRGMNANIVGGRYKIREATHAPMMKITGATILLDYNSVENTLTPFSFAHLGGATANSKLECSGVRFEIEDPNPAIRPTGPALDGGPATSAINAGFLRVFAGCTFDSRLERTVNSYGNGGWVFNSCIMAGSGTTLATSVVRAGASGAGVSAVTLNNCDYSQCGAGAIIVSIYRSSDNWTLKISGSYPSASWKYEHTGSVSVEGRIISHPDLWGSAPPAGFWPIGSTVRNSLPSAGGVAGWVKTDTSSTAGTWKSYGSIAS